MRRLLLTTGTALMAIVLSVSVVLAAPPSWANNDHGKAVSDVARAVDFVSGRAHGEAVSALARTHGKEVSAAARARAADRAAAGKANGSEKSAAGKAKNAEKSEPGRLKDAEGDDAGDAETDDGGTE